MSVRSKIKTAREMRGVTQAELADQIPMSEGNLRRIENGQQGCGPDIKIRVASILKKPWVADPTVPDDYKPLKKREAAFVLLAERQHVDALMNRETEILRDGIVDENERPDHEAFLKELGDEQEARRDFIYAEE